MNPFDSLQDTMFDTVTGTMGYDAAWLPNGSGDFDANDFNPEDFNTYSYYLLLARVLYNGPTEKERLFSADYDPEKLTMEYKAGDFPSLYESARNCSFEVLQIIDIGFFTVRSIRKKFDGKTFVATLKIIE
jgi:hypothetical protein